MSKVLAVALVGLCLLAPPTITFAQKRPAQYRFADGHRQPGLLSQILKNADEKPTFDGVYYQSYVSCGPGCDSYWFVDRRNHIVFEAPTDFIGGSEMIYEVRVSLSTDTLSVTYGPMDGAPSVEGNPCRIQRYVLAGFHFRALSNPEPIACPQ